MKSVLLAAASLCCFHTFAGESPPTDVCADIQNFTTYTSKRSFYRNSGTGTLAIAPNFVTRNDLVGAASYVGFVESGIYEIERNRPDAWFVVNHRLDDTDSKTTYLGVLVVKALRREQRSPLWLYRNTGWTPISSTSFPSQFGSFRDFFGEQIDDSNLEDFQSEFGIWHGTLTDNREVVSWAERREWHRSPIPCGAFKKFDLDSKSTLITAQLIRFHPTRRDDSSSPLALNILLRDAEAIFIATFSPASSSFSREYQLVFSR